MTNAKHSMIETDEKQLQILKWLGLLVVGVEILAAFFIGSMLKEKLAANPNDLGTAVQWIVSFIGTAMGINYILLQLKLDALLQREVRSLLRRELSNLYGLLPFFNSYFQTQTKDPYGFREKILTMATHRMDRLASGVIEVENEHYYSWLKDRLLTRRPHTVRAISCRPLVAYTTDIREKNFIVHNNNAVNLGTTISRIFLLCEKDLMDKASRNVLKDHFLNTQITNHVVWQNNISRDLLRELRGGGLSIYDTDEVFYDRSYFEQAFDDFDDVSLQGRKQSVIPRATIYSNGNEGLLKYIELFHQLEQSVDPAFKLSGMASYRKVLQHLRDWIEQTEGSTFELAKADIISEIENLA